mmetsp:Transcript_32910/g.49677  ORF Transcript_32910/g.49677 Transcript_32910/m.49677 type:complete len:273 (+) Transcript_32910:167-985(+)
MESIMSWFWKMRTTTTTILTMISSIMICGRFEYCFGYQILGEPKTTNQNNNNNNDIISIPLPHFDTTLDLYQQKREHDGSVSMPGTPWPASYELVNYMTHPSNRNQFQDKTILELGSGLGICSIVAALFLKPRRVVATDGSSTSLGLLHRNIQKYKLQSLNDNDGIIQVHSLDWGKPLSNNVRQSIHPKDYPDIVIASDVVYPRSDRIALKQTLQEVCGKDTTFLLGHTWRVQVEEDDKFFDSIGIPYSSPRQPPFGSRRPSVSILEFKRRR